MLSMRGLNAASSTKRHIIHYSIRQLRSKAFSEEAVNFVSKINVVSVFEFFFCLLCSCFSLKYSSKTSEKDRTRSACSK